MKLSDYNMEFLTRRELLALFRESSRKYRKQIKGGYFGLAEPHGRACRLVVSEWERRGFTPHPNRAWF